MLDIFTTDYWRALKKEFRLFLCTDDKRYADLRKKLDAAGTKSQTTIVSMIAASVAAHVGAVAGTLVPLCALILLAGARLGKNAICAELPLDIPIKEPKSRRNRQAECH